MNSWFDDKEYQLNTTTITAFDILLHTRHANALEMAEMLNFARAVTIAGINQAVKEVFYDSKACICSFELLRPLSDKETEALLEAARDTISQFQWEGIAYHGRNLKL